MRTRTFIAVIPFITTFILPAMAAAQTETSSTAILKAVDIAKEKLKHVTLPAHRVCGEDAVLAVWSPQEPDDVQLVPVAHGKSLNPDFAVKLATRNGVNSRYVVTSPNEYVVVALATFIVSKYKLVISRPRIPHSRKRRLKKTYVPIATTAATYSPYSPPLHTKSLADAGRQYLDETIDAAAMSLEQRQVFSSAFPGSLVTGTVPRDVLWTLLLIEHMTPSEFMADGTEHSVDRVLVTLGLNRESAYNYAFSKKKAGGLAQFIETTYKAMRRDYPMAGLKSEFIAGMRDHANAIKAEFCLIDVAINKLVSSDRYATLAANEEDLGAFIAASYNGGENRALKALMTNPRDWEKSGRGLMPETVTYVKLFRRVYRLLQQSRA